MGLRVLGISSIIEKTMGRKMNFQKLTPVISGNENAYKAAFDFVFRNNDLRNIAVSGPYGAGKSSVFESYTRNYKKMKM